MNKLLKIILIIFAVILVLILLISAYFYWFHVFKTMKICISEEKADMGIPCTIKEECIDAVKKGAPEIEKALSENPKMIKEKINEAFEESVICESTCKIKEIRGMNPNEEIITCESGDKEVILKIRGKEVIEILSFIKNNPEYEKSFQI
ncbi:MAG: hypothetical protein WC867_07855 [Candidatus Pacearchaeota archaeon]|jgi:hypothetical protein